MYSEASCVTAVGIEAGILLLLPAKDKGGKPVRARQKIKGIEMRNIKILRHASENKMRVKEGRDERKTDFWLSPQ